MSMSLCDECGGLVDTDDDPECFVDMVKRDGATLRTVVLCGECRITLEEEDDCEYN